LKRKLLPVPSRLTSLIAAAVVALALFIGGAAWLMRWDAHAPLTAGIAQVGGPFSLVNQDGRRVTEKDFLGRYTLVFFGYTYCPDVCPTELQVMTAALDEMGDRGKNIQPVFVSIDPERDTPETLKAYVGNFGGRLVGLTGTPEEVAQAAKAYRVYYRKSDSGDPKNYLMDHSSIIYLMGPDGLFIRPFTYTTDAKALAADLVKAIGSST
jgi:protein SCO1/2